MGERRGQLNRLLPEEKPESVSLWGRETVREERTGICINGSRVLLIAFVQFKDVPGIRAVKIL